MYRMTRLNLLHQRSSFWQELRHRIPAAPPFLSSSQFHLRFFGTTSRQKRANNESSKHEKSESNTDETITNNDFVTATRLQPLKLQIVENSRQPHPLLLLPRTNLFRQTWTSTTTSTHNSSSVFMASSHAIDLYDPHTHGGSALSFSSSLSAASSYEPPTPLWTHVLLPLLSVLGRPMSTADYMRLCLTHPEHGYYINATSHFAAADKDDFDSDNDYDDDDTLDKKASAAAVSSTDANIIIGGDFVTAPEVSQVFGECLGVWFATQHLQAQARSAATATATAAHHDNTNDTTGSSSSSSSSSSHNNILAWQWLECGPGKGTLMRDLVRFQSAVPDFDAGCKHIHFVETSSQRLRNMQKERLQELGEESGKVYEFHDNDDDASGERVASVVVGNDADSTPTPTHTISVHWHATFTAFEQWMAKHYDVSKDGPMATYCIGQEFLDALPVYSFEKTPEGYWRERLVSLPSDDQDQDVAIYLNASSTSVIDKNATSNQAVTEPKPRLVLVLAPEVTPALQTLLDVDEHGYLTNDSENIPVGSVMEVNPEGILMVQDLSRYLEQSAGGGAALFIDYGQSGSADSLRAFSRHEQLGFLSRPGLVDITADVDFAALKHAVNNSRKQRNGTVTTSETAGDDQNTVRAYGPVTQGDFLMAMGMQERVLNAIEDDKTTEDEAEDLYQAMVRLASPEEMGERYKVLCIVKNSADTPPGFE